MICSYNSIIGLIRIIFYKKFIKNVSMLSLMPVSMDLSSSIYLNVMFLFLKYKLLSLKFNILIYLSISINNHFEIILLE